MAQFENCSIAQWLNYSMAQLLNGSMAQLKWRLGKLVIPPRVE